MCCKAWNKKIIWIVLRSLFNRYVRTQVKAFRGIADRLGVNAFVKDIVLPNGQGFRMFLPAKDRGITDEILVGGVRERENVEYMIIFLEKYGGQIDMVFDIGSNIGYFVLIEDVLLSGVDIYALEPVPENYQVLQYNLMLNGTRNNVTVRQVALVGEAISSPMIEMHVPPQGNWANVSGHQFPGSKTIRVPVVTIADLIELIGEAKILLRMDIEGYEYEIFKAMRDWLQTRGSILVAMEFHAHLLGKQGSREFLALLKESGFVLEKVVFTRPAIYWYFPRGTWTFRLHNGLYEKIQKQKIDAIKRIISLDELILYIDHDEKNLHGYHLYLVKE